VPGHALTVIGGEEEDGVVVLPAPAQRIEYPPHVPLHLLHHAVVEVQVRTDILAVLLRGDPDRIRHVVVFVAAVILNALWFVWIDAHVCRHGRLGGQLRVR